MQLGNRLMTIISMIPKGSVIADIGTDHAHLPIYLVKKGVSPKVIATDKKQGPLSRAKANIFAAKLSHKIELRLGQGLEPILPYEVDAAVMAGMGGETIANIIRQSQRVTDSLNFFIMQPMKHQAQLRRELYCMGYEIIDEDVAVEDDKFYEIIKAKKGNVRPFDIKDIEIGPILKQKENIVIREYLNTRMASLQSLVEKLKHKKTSSAKKALETYEKRLSLLKEVLQ